ncbi:MAG: hypothetical protein QME60_08515 [Verrucomicrobiota bacterium]|nr:hypothetical protein [Verrucomicrobiota bacterium]
MAEQVIKLKGLAKEDVPADLRAETYFDFTAHPFEHQALFDQTTSVYGAIMGIGEYSVKWLEKTIAQKRSGARSLKNTAPGSAHVVGQFEVLLEEGAVFEPSLVIGSQKKDVCYAICVAKGARVIGAVFDVEKGGVFIGEGTVVEAGAGIKGPTIIGKNTEVRQGAYLRGDVIIGNNATIRGEIKNCVLLDKANFPHPSYLGDSACGYMTHFGNQATTANLGIFAGLVDTDKRKPLRARCGGKTYDLGKPKMGVCMGDFSQVGCNSVTDPATFLKPYTIAYTLCRISKGFYGPHEILKNKPIEHGVIERARYSVPE